ncbi:glucose dehydrogenase [FAD, quinone]-like [Trichogramma pretiosum]|uniref:glucose dehydrogenase [FAD, quinone]-like n=1 Tax=Trichogramma pretiosum TaxID=7493 RepID=UPI0006C9510E|nr:glucose dehydrogenase [FAD, quinone]-like [Trichogramma pretiosum]
MNKILFSSLILIYCLTITVVKLQEIDLKYLNLYGFTNFKNTSNEMLVNLAVGLMKFMRENDRIVHSAPKDMTPSPDQEFDFIVIGAGSAGSTIASRLSEIRDVTVLLIEAGGNENLMMDIPLLVNYLQFVDGLNWKYQTEPSDRYCLGMTNQQCNWPRGRVMGGSSVLNYMIATRGNPRDYDQWAEAGNDGWAYKDILKYFKKSENLRIKQFKQDKEVHNTEGPLHINYPPYHTPVAEQFLKAGLELGYPIIDYNAGNQTGFSYIQATIKNGTRMSTNRAYLHPARKRPNLFVTKFSHVNKLLIDKQNRAYGVEFTKSNMTIHVRAKKEVILSAGAINSPQILMLSGIGPAEHLRSMMIDVLQDAPVGENLMDHISYGGLVFLIDQPVSIVSEDVTNPMKPYVADFLNTKNGPLSIPGGCEALAFIDVDDPKNLDVFPNIELLFIGGSVVSDNSFRNSFGISEKYWDKMYAQISGRHSWSIFPMLMRPRSRGKIFLRSRDPKAKPKIFPNYFEDPEDLRLMVKGIRASIEISKTKAMQTFSSEIYNVSVPECENYEYDSDEYWACAARTFSFTIYHYSGTCKMAPANDPTGVVDPKLRVKGIKGLRVADASIMPIIMTGHTNIPTIMIGEKLSDMLKHDWNLI